MTSKIFKFALSFTKSNFNKIMKLIKDTLAFLVILTCMFSCFQAKAAKHKENFPLEEELDQDTPRSIHPIQPVQEFLEENKVSLEFYKYMPNVIITIKDSNEQIIYTKTCFGPEMEVVSLADLSSGIYTLELRTERGGYMYGTFLYADQ